MDQPTSCPVAIGDLASPSLSVPGQSARAYEIKFLVSEPEGQAVEDWAREHLQLDAHGDPAQRNSYQTMSLYTDTPQFDVYYRTSKYRRRKFRIRRYGQGSDVFLERKTRQGDTVAKRREAVPLADLLLLGHPLSVTNWPGHWFHSRLLARDLRPVCQIRYRRTAFAGSMSEGPVRLTLDRHVQGALISEWNLEHLGDFHSLLEGLVILELKFREAMPALFKRLVQDRKLSPTGVSKYRRCLEAWSVPMRRTEEERKYA